jgi:integral membrane sensor domain MASE1
VNLVSISIFTAQDPRSSDRFAGLLILFSCLLPVVLAAQRLLDFVLLPPFLASKTHFPVVVGSLFECDCLQLEADVVLELPNQKT